MDPALISTLLIPAFGALGIVGTYLSRQSRRDRSELRRARRWMQESDIHMDFLERDGYSMRGRRPPPRPKILEITHDDADTDRQAEADDGADQASPGSGSRHALHEG